MIWVDLTLFCLHLQACYGGSGQVSMQVWLDCSLYDNVLKWPFPLNSTVSLPVAGTDMWNMNRFTYCSKLEMLEFDRISVILLHILDANYCSSQWWFMILVLMLSHVAAAAAQPPTDHLNCMLLQKVPSWAICCGTSVGWSCLLCRFLTCFISTRTKHKAWPLHHPDTHKYTCALRGLVQSQSCLLCVQHKNRFIEYKL